MWLLNNDFKFTYQRIPCSFKKQLVLLYVKYNTGNFITVHHVPRLLKFRQSQLPVTDGLRVRSLQAPKVFFNIWMSIATVDASDRRADCRAEHLLPSRRLNSSKKFEWALWPLAQASGVTKGGQGCAPGRTTSGAQNGPLEFFLVFAWMRIYVQLKNTDKKQITYYNISV